VSTPDPQPSARGRAFVAAALIAVGALILVPSGLCSAVLGIGAVVELVTAPERFLADVADTWPFALTIFAIAIVGILLVRGGYVMRERN